MGDSGVFAMEGSPGRMWDVRYNDESVIAGCA